MRKQMNLEEYSKKIIQWYIENIARIVIKHLEIIKFWYEISYNVKPNLY